MLFEILEIAVPFLRKHKCSYEKTYEIVAVLVHLIRSLLYNYDLAANNTTNILEYYKDKYCISTFPKAESLVILIK